MQKWEYLHVYKNRGYEPWRKGEGFHRAGDWRFFIYTKDGISDIQFESMEDMTNKLGDEGWELVTFAAQSDFLGGIQACDLAGFTTQQIWVFKRPKG